MAVPGVTRKAIYHVLRAVDYICSGVNRLVPVFVLCLFVVV